MEIARAPRPVRGRAGTTLIELMIAVVIMSVGVLGLFGAFRYISRSLHVSRAQTLATNLAQEKIEVLKNSTYYDLMITTSAGTDANGILYDKANYPPESISISNINYTRYTYVTMASESGGSIVSVGANYPDTGLKEIVVNVIWTENGKTKRWTLTNLLENPSVNPLDATISGSVTDSGGGALPGALVEVEQNNDWSGATDVNGNYSFQVYHGTYTVRASSAGFYDAVSANTAVARGATAAVSLSLDRISTGTVAGIAWYNPSLVISQVVASTVSAGYDAEYVELFNPTTAPVNIGSGSSPIVNLNYGSGANEACSDIPLIYVSTYVAPGHYYLIESTSSIVLNGASYAADAYYDSSKNHANCNPWSGGHWDTTNGMDVIISGHSGLVWLTDFGGNTLDSVGWTNGGASPNGCSGHCTASCNGTCIPQADALPAGEQIVRVSSPAATLAASGTDTYGRAYDSQNNSVDFFYPTAPTTYQIQYPPKNTASGAYPVIAGKVPSGVVVSASDQHSASLTAYSATIASGSLSLPYVPFTLPGVTTGTCSVALSYAGGGSVYAQFFDGVDITQNQTTAIPNAATSPSWSPAGFFQAQLTSTTDGGFVDGTVTDIYNVPLANIPVQSGGTTKVTSASGQYFMSVSSGANFVTANPTNYGGSNASYVQIVTPVTVDQGAVTTQDFVLSLGARLTGYVTTGTTPVPNQVVNALVGGNQMATGTTDGTGVFWINNVATGTYTIEPIINDGQSSDPGSMGPISVNSTGTIFVGTFTVSGAFGNISGTVKEGADLVTTGALIIASTAAIPATLPAIVASSAPAQTAVYMISSKADGSYTLPVRGSATYNLAAYVPVVSNSGVVTIKTQTYSGITVGVGATVTKAVVLP